MGIDICIGGIRAIGGGLVLEVDSLENKREVMKRRSGLGRMNLWLEEELTERKKVIQGWLNKVEREERRRGVEARASNGGIMIKGDWWDRLKNTIWEVSRETGLAQKQGGRKGRSEDWEVCEQKKRVWKALKELVRTRGSADKENLKKESKLKQEGGTFYVGFVDFRTAFDSVDRGRLMERL
ncbi:hypothetical protein M0802_012034 [Mischocyttarus mexicanus]|nr:hypothetical protein M0802_012034 [Mischocyttarus mexicanus]